jgi:hypothetical protein
MLALAIESRVLEKLKHIPSSAHAQQMGYSFGVWFRTALSGRTSYVIYNDHSNIRREK